MLALASCDGWAGADEIIRRRAEPVAALRREVEQAGREASGAALEQAQARVAGFVCSRARRCWPELGRKRQSTSGLRERGLLEGRRCSGCAARVGARRDKTNPARASSWGRANQLLVRGRVLGLASWHPDATLG
jgi:hypothetical protein